MSAMMTKRGRVVIRTASGTVYNSESFEYELDRPEEHSQIIRDALSNLMTGYMPQIGDTISIEEE